MVIVALIGAGTFAVAYIQDQSRDRWDERVSSIAEFVELERGLLFDHPVDVEFVSEDNFVSIFDTSGHESDAVLHADNATFSQLYNAAGLASDIDLFESGNQVAAVSSLGFYEPSEDRIYIRGVAMTPAIRAVIAHELTHALQAQHFDLGLGGHDDLARRSIVEADAMRVEARFVSTLTPDEQRTVEVDNSLSDDDASALDGAPAMLIEEQYAPYVLGPMLVADIFSREGNRGVDRLLETPPTEEVLIDPTLDGASGTVAAAAIEAPADAVLIEAPRQASMFDTLAMLDAWLPWTQARTAVEGWAGGGYVSYERGPEDPTVCFAMSVAFDVSTDAFAGAVSAWAAASGSSAVPVVVGDRVQFEACDRGPGAPVPPPPVVPMLSAIVFEHNAVAALGSGASPDVAAGIRCLARATVDDPTAGPLLLQAELDLVQVAAFEDARFALLDRCGASADGPVAQLGS